jgi:RHS repeat-associated protein
MIPFFQAVLPRSAWQKFAVFLSVAEILISQTVSAQVGNDNPTGVAGQFNGNITTGCSYDPYTGNAMRAVTDIVVSGTVGTYPLAFSRVSNSRFGGAGNFQFGTYVSWRHSYTWGMDNAEESTQANFRPTEYSVVFPDGRAETFFYSSSDAYFRAGPGIGERFIPLDASMRAYLVLPDGGKVRFKATPYSWIEYRNDLPPSTPPPELALRKNVPDDIRAATIGGTTWYGYSYQAEAIIDPYGLETTLTYNSDGGLSKIQEKGGRSIEIFYATPSCCNWERVIDYIQASDGRTVKYNYNHGTFGSSITAYTYLYNVVYFPDPSVSSPPTAAYTYQQPNAGSINGPPLLSTAYDPMYSGPMKGISYEYATGVNSDTTAVAYGQIRAERSIEGVLVSQLAVGYYGRRETKGDGGARDFRLDPPRVVSWSDFVNYKFAYQHYDSVSGYVDYTIDRNGATTTFTSDPLIGNITAITYPQTPGDTPAGTPAGSLVFRYVASCSEDSNNCDPANPYYLYSSRDEAYNTTVYLRDEHKRIRQINYPDGATETFQYNDFNQIVSHQARSGGLESFEYDPGTHLQSSFRDAYHDPVNHTGKPTAWYQYNDRGWLTGITDWRGSEPGDANFTTGYDYNLRGQVTVIRHPLDATTQIRYTVQRNYNPDGTLDSTTDESGHVTSYGYDDYKRVSSVTPPPADGADALPRTTHFYYDRVGGTALDYSHTDARIGNVTTPLGKTAKALYNWNLQEVTEIAGSGSEAGTTTYTYDYVGNLKTVKDPAGQDSGLYTEYFYDERNRLSAINDPISSDRNSLGYSISYTYDGGGRRKSEQRANNQLVTYDNYDPMNRLTQKSVQRDTGVFDVTLMSYDFAGNLATFQDPRGKLYYYGHDYLSRPTSIVYPGDHTSEWSHYDLANNRDTFTNREGAVQTFEYDNRNRQTHYYWDTWPQYTLHERWISYDERNNLTHIWTEGQDTTDIAYDWRNRKTSETQKNAGRAPHTIGYTYDADSDRKSMIYPSGYVLNYDYNSRNQLWHQVDTNGIFATYTYDSSGNRRTRSLRNGTVTNYTPDAMNRVRDVSHLRGGTTLGRFDYHYDPVGRIKSVKRDFSRGDSYDYYLDDQVKSVQYDAYNVDLDSPWDPQNITSLSYDANGNRVSQSNSASPSYSYGVNDLNQYTSVNNATPDYDALGNLAHYGDWEGGYNRNNQLTAAVKDPTYLFFYYDGLNRQILRYTENQWVFSVWDGWNLIEEYDINDQLIHTYVHGAAVDEMVQRFDPGANPNRIWFYQDGQGSTTHLTNDAGVVLEKYKYPPADAGTPAIFDGNDVSIASSLFDNRFLYTGREYFKEANIYDYRNRTYAPFLGRFVQPDPIGFNGDAGNLYRYCGNSLVNRIDPSGLVYGNIPGAALGIGGLTTGAIGGFAFGLANQIYSYSAGNGFSVSQVGFDTAVGGLTLGAAGFSVGAVSSADPVAISEAVTIDAAAVAAVGGLFSAMALHHLQPPVPPQAQAPAPQPPPPQPAPSPSSTPPGPPQIYTDPATGTPHNPNGTALPTGEENGLPPGTGSVIPFAFGGYPVVAPEGDFDHYFFVLLRKQ